MGVHFLKKVVAFLGAVWGTWYYSVALMYVFIKFIKIGKIAKFKFQRYFSSCRVTHLKSGGGIFSNNTIATVTRSSDDVAAWPCDLISDMVVLIHRRHLANICAYNNNKTTLVKSVTPLNIENIILFSGNSNSSNDSFIIKFGNPMNKISFFIFSEASHLWLL